VRQPFGISIFTACPDFMELSASVFIELSSVVNFATSSSSFVICFPRHWMSHDGESWISRACASTQKQLAQMVAPSPNITVKARTAGAVPCRRWVAQTAIRLAEVISQQFDSCIWVVLKLGIVILRVSRCLLPQRSECVAIYSNVTYLSARPQSRVYQEPYPR
jgi:hypothetical protein